MGYRRGGDRASVRLGMSRCLLIALYSAQGKVDEAKQNGGQNMRLDLKDVREKAELIGAVKTRDALVNFCYDRGKKADHQYAQEKDEAGKGSKRRCSMPHEFGRRWS
jgi:hypothetical protein